MSAKKAIYIRQKTVPLALTATSRHHHPLSVCLGKHTLTRVCVCEFPETARRQGRATTFHLRAFLHVWLNNI